MATTPDSPDPQDAETATPDTIPFQDPQGSALDLVDEEFDQPAAAADQSDDPDSDDDWDDEERPLEDLSLLEDKTPDWFKTTYRVPLVTFVLGLLFLFFTFRPLWHTDVWGHLAYGRWIVEHGALPSTEPLLPLAAGQAFVDTAWLSKLVGYGIVQVGGLAGLQFVNGLGVMLVLGILFAWIGRRTGSYGWGVLAVVVALFVGWEHLDVFRPQLAGLVLFTALLAMLDGPPRRWQLVAVPLGFVLWTNLHGSFLLGLGLLAAFAVGRGFDVVLRSGQSKSLFHDRRFGQAFVLLELAAVASLINPFGLNLHLEALRFASNTNLAGLIEWQPLSVDMLQGRMAAFALVALFVVHRFSPRRPSTTELLLLVGLGLAAVWTSRFVVWWGIVAAWSLALHASAIWNRRRGTLPVVEPAERGGKWTVVAIGIGWIVFAISPLGFQLLHGERIDPRRALSVETPVEMARVLREEPPVGLVYARLEWGDYLMWAGPENMQVYANSHVPVLPTEVWEHNLRISAGAYGWDELLERYGVNTVVMAHVDGHELIGQLRQRKEDWELVYEDRLGAIFERRTPILAGPDEPAAHTSDPAAPLAGTPDSDH